MIMRRLGDRNLIRGARWLFLISLCCLSGRCIGQTYNDFSYSVSGINLTITGYTGPRGAITIPSSIPGVNGTVTSIGNRAFYQCPGYLTSVTIPSSVTSIGDAAFGWCSGISGITIPSSVTSIGIGAFEGCSGLTSVAIPSSVTFIANGAFYSCSRLVSVTIPSSVTNIGEGPFAVCTRLTAISVDAQNEFYCSLGGLLFDKSQKTLIQYPVGRAGAYSIPSSVTSIGCGAFEGCSGLTSVTIPSSVTFIGAWAFLDCIGLSNVTIPSSVTNIDGGAFCGCTGISSITIPCSVASIGDYGFYWCWRLTSMYFQGDAPATFGSFVFSEHHSVSIYYPSTASGWSTPTWQGYSAQPYDYSPQPLLGLVLSSGVVTPSFNRLLPGTEYQLQVSTDLVTWTDTGLVFTATNTSQAYSQPFGVSDWNRLFFRLGSPQ